MTDAVSGIADQASKVADQTTKTATDTAQSVTKQNPLRADFERKADQLQRRKPRTARGFDESEEEESDPEFIPTARHGKHRIVPVKVSRIADRPQSNKDSTMRIKIELDLEVEVEIYARVKGDITLGLL